MAEGLADQLSEHKKTLLAKIILEEMAMDMRIVFVLAC
jgi:hypothetical protein